MEQKCTLHTSFIFLLVQNIKEIHEAMEQTLGGINDLKQGLVDPDKSSNAISKKCKGVSRRYVTTD